MAKDNFLGVVIIVFLIVMVFITITAIQIIFQQYQYLEYRKGIYENLLPSPPPAGFDSLNCNVIVTNGTISTAILDFWASDYQEANAIYEQKKPQLEDWMQQDVGFNHSSWKIKWLECH